MAKIRSALVALMMALLVAGVMSRRVLEAAAVTVSDDELFMSKSQFEKLISAFSGDMNAEHRTLFDAEGFFKHFHWKKHHIPTPAAEP
ncbi:hypothetical protein H632_c2400p0 [Helicosporidium sp. ATCC 50920]|nr:hypothetical protein H632_c2400p0 [Helicosporidium sp. ATCC 50920]|eukprot:KDD73233.1 hypothetical protein H632_c2400p0 [Helicosporidium sp. ATCC 50920]